MYFSFHLNGFCVVDLPGFSDERKPTEDILIKNACQLEDAIEKALKNFGIESLVTITKMARV